jgi:hypothetical protein
MKTLFLGFSIMGFLFMVAGWISLYTEDPWKGFGFLVCAGVCFVLAILNDPNRPKGGSVKWTEG